MQAGEWRKFLNDNQQKIVAGAEVYAKDPYPDPGSNLKLVIAEMARMLDTYQFSTSYLGRTGENEQYFFVRDP